MLTQEQLTRICNEFGLGSQARAIISQTLAQPSKGVRNQATGNVVGRYPSAKMGFTVQFASHKVELPAIMEYEYDPDVIGYADRPPAVRLEYSLANGRAHAVDVTPTFLVIRRSGVVYEEW